VIKQKTILAILAAAGAAFVTILVIAPLLDVDISFLKPYFLFGLIFWIIMAAGINITLGFMGYMPFGYVAFFGIGSYVSSALWSKLGVHIIVAILAGGVAGVLWALILAPTLRLTGIYFGLVNLAFAVILQVIISEAPASIGGGVYGISLARIYDPVSSYYMALGVMIAAMLTIWRLSRSKLGISLKCIREDADAAAVMGINVVKYRVQAWLIASIFPSLAGGINAWYTAIVDPESSFNLLITAKSVIYALFGGLGTLLGPIVGSSVLYFVDEVIWSRFPFWNVFILGLVIVVLVLFLPKGLIGTLSSRYPRWRTIL
jgi:branched-chain amino acid transport system permease protein